MLAIAAVPSDLMEVHDGISTAPSTSTAAPQDSAVQSTVTRKRRRSFNEKDLPPADIGQTVPVGITTSGKDAKMDPTGKVPLGREKSELRRKAWPVELTTYFFDALKLYGKDFDKITKHLKLKTKSASLVKNYEQVRNLYYNTAKILSQHLKLSDDSTPGLSDVSREIREIFVLVNFAEWRRKLGPTVNVAFAKDKFHELVFTGSTLVKYHKRLVRVKTPVCPALKKIFGTAVDEFQALPIDISVQIVPSRRRDESYIAYLRQNPLLKANFSPSVPVRQLLSFLHRKWSLAGPSSDAPADSQSPLSFYFGNRRLSSMQVIPGNVQQRVQSIISLERFIKSLSKSPEVQLSADTAELNGSPTTSDSGSVAAKSDPTETASLLYVNVEGSPTHPAAGSNESNTYTFLADMFDKGLSLDNCHSLLTIGHLYMMYRRPDVLVLEYRIRDELTESRIASGAWNCLVTLLRTEYLELLQKKVPVQPPLCPVSPTTAAANLPSLEQTEIPSALPLPKPAGGAKNIPKRRPPPKQTALVPEAKPSAGSGGKRRGHQLSGLEADRSPNFSMANEQLAFMDQLGQLHSRKRSKNIVARSFASDVNFTFGGRSTT